MLRTRNGMKVRTERAKRRKGRGESRPCALARKVVARLKILGFFSKTTRLVERTRFVETAVLVKAPLARRVMVVLFVASVKEFVALCGSLLPESETVAIWAVLVKATAVTIKMGARVIAAQY